ncbi:glycosyltransferase family 2 protein [Pseudooceanicola aestuarii]|uniref:glycosyltransferase family 2 protein n=1 Tax=Pseudooceanicola aestuarii TaxID=2697319 RepID=UPI0013D6BFB0|nr:glycosyltransferase family 2 protein [Pseudooceanicola aestuarii]
MIRWGVVTTIRASLADTLAFAAWHLELGAHRIYLHLDDPDDPAFDLLKAHPRLRPLRCDVAYWQRLAGRRPAKHQLRQTRNATRIYNRPAEVDWLAHIDGDEFLVPDRPVADILADLPATCHAARLRPMEGLPRPEGAPAIAPLHRFKSFALDPPTRHAQTEAIYPSFGRWLNGGFLSHVAGKLFVRPGLTGAEFRIHNLLTDQGRNPGQQEVPQLRLAHLHYRDWADWRARLDFRLNRGAYRAELQPARPNDPAAMTLHDLLAGLAREEGEAGLRRFYDEVCPDTPDLRDRLLSQGQLREAVLDLAGATARQFPQQS